MLETFKYQFRALEACLQIIVTLFIHHNKDLPRRIIYRLCMPFLKMSQIKSKQKDIQKIAIYVIYIFIYQLINNYKCITVLNI